MSRIIRHLFSMLLAGAFALALLGTAPLSATIADGGYCAELDGRGDPGAPPALNADLDGDALPAATPIPAATEHCAASAGLAFPFRTVTHLGHWPHAPPL